MSSFSLTLYSISKRTILIFSLLFYRSVCKRSLLETVARGRCINSLTNNLSHPVVGIDRMFFVSSIQRFSVGWRFRDRTDHLATSIFCYSEYRSTTRAICLVIRLINSIVSLHRTLQLTKF